MARKKTTEKIIVANWKMYKTSHEATRYIEELLPLIQGLEAKILLAVPYTSIAAAAKEAKGSALLIGAQNMCDASEGAFTGEIAAIMLKEAGAEFVLLGHSERRRVFHESNELIRRKVARALQDDLIPILCVGETLEEREAGRMEEVLHTQLAECLQDIPEEALAKLMVAYEPVWAIGTGKSATPKIAADAHEHCRKILIKLLGKKVGGSVPVLYGGSVNAENAADLAMQNEIGGVLIGGASLNAKTLAKIAERCTLNKEKS